MFSAATTAEQTCNNPERQCRMVFLAVPVAGSGGRGHSNCINVADRYRTRRPAAEGYAKPSWQTALDVPNDGKRDVPDVSLFAGDGFNSGAST